MMDCDIIQDLLPLYADGLTSESSNRQIEDHIRTCPECSRLRGEMCAPIEQESTDEEQRTMNLLRIQRRKQRLRMILPWVLAVLVCATGWWLIMEMRFSGELIYAASTNEEKILIEMPGLALTDEELALAETILEIPGIRDAVSYDRRDPVTLDAEILMPYLSPILPDNGRFTEIFVYGHSIYISIIAGKQYTCLMYNDVDMTGHIDTVSKTLTISPLDEIGEDGYLGDVDTVYELIYAVGTGITRCQQLKSRHMWFSFLDIP